MNNTLEIPPVEPGDPASPQQPVVEPQPVEQPQLYPPSNFPDPIPPPTPKKKSKKGKVFIALLILVLLAGGGAYAWLTYGQTYKQNRAKESAKAVARDNIYFQLGDSLYSYNTTTKAKEILTSNVPDDYFAIIDFYADDSTWRLYYQLGGGAKTAIYYLEKGHDEEDPGSVEAEIEGFVYSVADAKNKIVAYSVTPLPTPYGSGSKHSEKYNKVNTTKTYILKDKKSELIYEADPSEKNLKDPLYIVSEISPDSKRLLFNRANCFDCLSGMPATGMSATAFEFDLEEKTATQVYKSTKPEGYTFYKPGGGYYIIELRPDSYPFGDDPYEETYLELDKPLSEPKTIFDVREDSWSFAYFDPDYNILALEKKVAGQPGETAIEGIFKRSGTRSSDLTKYNLPDNFPIKDYFVYELSNVVNNCVGISIQIEDKKKETANNPIGTTEVGILCGTDTNTLTYTKIQSEEPGSGTPRFFY